VYYFPPSSSSASKISANKLKIKKFKESYKAESSSMWKDYNIYMGYAENNFVWEERGAVGTIHDHLINNKKGSSSLK